MVTDKVKTAERGSARAAEQVFRTRALVPSGAVAESRVDKLLHLLRCKRHMAQEQLRMTGKDGSRVQVVGDTRFGELGHK